MIKTHREQEERIKMKPFKALAHIGVYTYACMSPITTFGQVEQEKYFRRIYGFSKLPFPSPSPAAADATKIFASSTSTTYT